jgi:Xaa-Pro aminopeptidase
MDKQFHSKNRQRLAEHMADGEAMLFFSGESLRKTADEDFPFFTNRNFLYLTGIKQERFRKANSDQTSVYRDQE